MQFVQDCEYELELNSHSETMLAWRYGLTGEVANGRNTVTGFFKKTLRHLDGRIECIFALEGCRRVHLIVDGDAVITALATLKSFSTPDAQQIVSMMEGIRLVNPSLLSATDIVGFRQHIIESNRPAEKDAFRRQLRKFLKAIDVGGSTQSGDQASDAASSASESAIDAFDGDLSAARKLPFDQLLEMKPEELEQIAEIGIPETNRFVRYWNANESLKILAVEDIQVIYAGELQGSSSFRVFYQHGDSVYRLHTIWPKAVESYQTGDSVLYVKDYGSDGNLYVENPVPHREYEDELPQAV